jgi:transcriptional regulator
MVGIRLPIPRLEGKWKMSQNRESKDREGVVAGLRRRGAGEDAEIAEIVAREMSPRR